MIQVITLTDDNVAYPEHRVLSIRKNDAQHWILTITSLANQNSTQTIGIKRWREGLSGRWSDAKTQVSEW